MESDCLPSISFEKFPVVGAPEIITSALLLFSLNSSVVAALDVRAENCHILRNFSLDHNH